MRKQRQKYYKNGFKPELCNPPGSCFSCPFSDCVRPTTYMFMKQADGEKAFLDLLNITSRQKSSVDKGREI